MICISLQDTEALTMLKVVTSPTSPASAGATENSPQIWAVASGKGGVGKSFIASNLGLALAQSGRRTIVVDLDLGGANLHTHLGITRPKHSLSHFINGKKSDLKEMIESLPGTTLGIISGASDHLEVADLKQFQKLKLIRHLLKLPADYVILDLGAGTTYNTLDFFNLADQGILSVIPEPTSIENSHRFLKSAMYRKLRDVPADTKSMVKEILGTPSEQTSSLNTLNKIIDSIHQQSPKHGKILRRRIDRAGLHLIVNQIREPADFQLGYSMALIWKQYYGKKPDSLSFLNHDDSIVKALCEHHPYLHEHPHSRNAIQLKHLVKTIINKKK